MCGVSCVVIAIVWNDLEELERGFELALGNASKLIGHCETYFGSESGEQG